MKYGYYPGCSLEKNASSYHVSAMAVAKQLGVEFVELDDWNCCGATEYIALNKMAAYTLVARNLVLAKRLELNGGTTKQLVAPCSACFLNLSKAETYLTESANLRERVNTALAAGGMTYTGGGLQVRHLLDIFVNDVKYDEIAKHVTRPLSGLRIAPYYGCLIVRPAFQGVFDDPEFPTSLDKLMKALGAKVVDFPMKAACCGGHMTQLSEKVSADMIHNILKNAKDYEADVIVTLCPMCQLNLDAYQNFVAKIKKTSYDIPVLYFTQLMGLAFGMSAEELEIGKEFVDARPALAKIGVEVQEPEPTRRKRPPKEELPMPRMPEEG
jgi:heterodisulfide reductase subunit B